MKCTHCGGNIGIEDKVCPFCGQPNLHALQHQEDMERYEAAFEKTRQRVEARTSRFAGLAVPLTLLGILLALAVGSVIFSARSYDIGRSLAMREMSSHADEYQNRIDGYIADGDYLMLNAYYSSKSLYMLTGIDGGPLEGYDMIFRASDYYSRIFETLLVRLEPDNYRFTRERISGTCEELADDLTRLFSLEKESYYPESCYEAERIATVAALQKQVQALLQTYAGFTADETAGIKDLSKAKLQAMLEEKMDSLMKEAQ